MTKENETWVEMSVFMPGVWTEPRWFTMPTTIASLHQAVSTALNGKVPLYWVDKDNAPPEGWAIPYEVLSRSIISYREIEPEVIEPEPEMEE